MATTRDINVEELITKIITNPPQPPKSILVSFECFTSSSELFEFCMELFMELNIYKYGNNSRKVDVSNWTSKTLDMFKEYFASIGLSISFIVTTPNDPNIAIYNSMKYEKTKNYKHVHLSNILYILNTGNSTYIVSFDHL